MPKKVVHVGSTPSGKGGKSTPTWKPTPEAKGKATRLRWIAALLWLLAIAGEAATIIWVLNPEDAADATGAVVPGEVDMVWLIGAIVVIGILAIVGSLLWKKANKLDPASRAQAFRFFVQNQLGAIVTIIAFLPLIILIFLNKDMDKQQKTIAGTVGIVVAVIALAFGISWNPPSTEEYTAQGLTCAELPMDTTAEEIAVCNTDTARVIELTGEDEVFWTKEGEVFHLCEDASAVNLESEDNTIYSGTVADAIEAGKDRLTLQIDMEMGQCGLDTDDPAEEEEEAA